MVGKKQINLGWGGWLIICGGNSTMTLSTQLFFQLKLSYFFNWFADCSLSLFLVRLDVRPPIMTETGPEDIILANTLGETMTRKDHQGFVLHMYNIF